MVGIITVVYSENCGSILQAFALSEAIKSLGHETAFVKVKNGLCSHTPWRCALRVGKRLALGSVSRAKREIEKYRYFEDVIQRLLPMRTLEELRQQGVDRFVLGSDTIWDVDRERFLQSADFFWPRHWEEPVIVYAASAANSTLERMKALEFPQEAMMGFSAISVRDTHTARLVENLSGRRAAMVCDPTLLLPQEAYSRFCGPVGDCQHIAVYLFEPISEEGVSQIREFAEKNGLKLISLGKTLTWCDQNVSGTVENFLSYIRNARYVVTNTFHGTIFSILFEKQFISFAQEKRKVTEMLGLFQLQERIWCGEKAAAELLESPVDYGKVNEKLRELRITSLGYLKDQLGEESKK